MYDVTGRLARASSLHPGRALAAWGAALLLSLAAIVGLLGSALTTDAEMTNDPESYRGYDLIAEHFPPTGDYVNELVVVRSRTLTVDDARLPREGRRPWRARSRRPGSRCPSRTYYSTQDATLVSPSRRATVIPVGLTGDGDAGIGQVIEAVDAAAGDGFETAITGEFTADRDFSTLSQEDLRKGELQFGLPAALVVLLLVFGAVVAGLVPVLVALVAIVVALGLTALVGQAFDLSVFVVNMISGMGLALGIDYSLFVVSRFREERRHGHEKLDAITTVGCDGEPRRAVQRLRLRPRDGGDGARPRHDPPQPRDRRDPRRHGHRRRGAHAPAGGALAPRRPCQCPPRARGWDGAWRRARGRRAASGRGSSARSHGARSSRPFSPPVCSSWRRCRSSASRPASRASGSSPTGSTRSAASRCCSRSSASARSTPSRSSSRATSASIPVKRAIAELARRVGRGSGLPAARRVDEPRREGGEGRGARRRGQQGRARARGRRSGCAATSCRRCSTASTPGCWSRARRPR